jgi:tetratricopeptide (TPR) repeat protein
MGKKAKSAGGVAKASSRKPDRSTWPPPPKPIHEEVGSAKILDRPSLEGDSYKVIGQDGYDDGGVADLSLLIDLEDSVQRRRRGEAEYFSALKANILPRATRGPMARLDRREQKVQLAQLLFSEAEDTEERSPSEVYVDQVDGSEDQATLQHRAQRLRDAKYALNMSILLREPACASLSLAEICKRRLTLVGKAGAEDSLRCADKAIQIAGDGFYDNDDIAMEAEENPVVDPKYEVDPTTPGLANPAMLKLLPLRVSHLCLRSALLQRGNALSALGRDDEARATYESNFPMLEGEPRCARVDWERHSLYVNIGNTYCRQGDFEKAHEQYKLAEKLGQEHLDEPNGSQRDGLGMVIVAKRAAAFALKKEGKEDEAKGLMKEVITMQIKKNLLDAEKKERDTEQRTMEKAEEAATAYTAARNSNSAPSS